MNDIRILCGNSIDEMAGLQDESIDLIIADPPYNLGKQYGSGKSSDKLSFEEYVSFSQKWLTESQRILSMNGTLYVFVGFRMISYVYQILEKELEMNFVNWLCWHYTQGIGKKKGFSPRHDDILMFSKSSQYTFNLDAVRVPQKYYRSVNNMRGANPGDVWEFSHVHYCNENRQDHPTQKPEGLIERMVLASSNPGDHVLDPFSGSGTTLRVCQQTNRICTGIEINPEYVEMTKCRLARPFNGFDSIDPRMERVPDDLNDNVIRDEYIKNHVQWFLSNHESQEPRIWQAVEQKYGITAESILHKKKGPIKQSLLFDCE